MSLTVRNDDESDINQLSLGGHVGRNLICSCLTLR